MTTKIISYDNLATRSESMGKTSRLKKIGLEGRSYKLPCPYEKRNGILEKDILKAVKSACFRTFEWHMRVDVAGKIIWGAQGGALTPSQMLGMPDLIALREGRFYAIEVKTSGGTVSAAQLACLTQIQKAGGISCIVIDINNFLAGVRVGYVETIPVY